MKKVVEHPSTLFNFLVTLYPDSPRTRIKKLLQSGIVKVNDRPITLHSFQLRHGDLVELDTRTNPSSKAKLPFPILYEDQYIIVVDKPAGTSTSSLDGSASIQKIVSNYLKIMGRGNEHAFVVHRIDKEVSGALLFAKSEIDMNSIKDNWLSTEKHYYALVEGFPEKPTSTIKSWLIEDKSLKMHSTWERENAKFAITHYSTIRKVNINTLLDVELETGRKNQIRVHLSDIGCPIVGDRKYGASDKFIRRIRLHAYSLSFPHPRTGEIIAIKSTMPNGFLSLKEKDEHYK